MSQKYTCGITNFESIVTQRYGQVFVPTTGINEQESDIIYSVYPNPADEILNIDFKRQPDNNILFHIVDLNGRIVYSNLLMNSLHNEIPIESIPGGIYLMKLTSTLFIRTEKLIVR